MWTIFSAILVISLVLLFLRKPPPITSVAPEMWWNPNLTHPAPVDSPPVSPLTTPQRELIPAPLYEEHRGDPSLPDDAEVERHTDGYFYPRAFVNFWNNSFSRRVE